MSLKSRKGVKEMTTTIRCAASVAAVFAMLCAAHAEEGVKVSSFGWNPEDSTRFIQAALDSDAPVIVLDRQAGPWISLPLVAHSNKKIVFEPGVELQAKKGAFREKRVSLFLVCNVPNVTTVDLAVEDMKKFARPGQK